MIPDAVFTLALAKSHLRVLHDHEDAIIGRLLDAAVSRAERFLGMALTERNVAIEFRADDPHRCRSRLFYDAPLAFVESVTEFGYVDSTGAPKIMPADSFVVTPLGISVKAWPSDVIESGVYAVALYKAIPMQPDDIPADIVAAVLLYLGDLFANREAGIVGTIYTPNPAAEAMLWPHKRDLHA
jgi:uncharacterized phiE125 gp8 family phage protein